MDRKKHIFGLVAISVITLGFFSHYEIKGLQQLTPYKTTFDPKPKFVAKRHRIQTDLKRNVSRKQAKFQNGSLKRSVWTNVQSIETKPGIFQAKPEVRHIAYLKVHKAASTTIQNILFRFGTLRNLSFVLPVRRHYFSKTSERHLPLIPSRRSGQYDILCLHATFNYSIYSSILPKDTVYIASVREPWTQFVSAVNYYTTVYHRKYLKKIPGNKIENLIRYPEIYEKSSLSKTMNSMAKDFGFHPKHYKEVNSSVGTSSTMAYLNKLGSIFQFVLITEHLEESLIILKRRLRWSLKDILYMSKNVKRPGVQVSEKLMERFRQRNKLDFIIYDYFFKKFEVERKGYGDDLIPETENFKKVLVRLKDWCAKGNGGELVIDATKWNERFSITSLECILIVKGELQFVNLIRNIALNH